MCSPRLKPRRRVALAGAVLCLSPITTRAQAPRVPTARDGLLLAPAIGSAADDRRRLRQIAGLDSTRGWLVRSLSSRLAPSLDSGGRLAVRVLAPEAFEVSNSRLPFTQNDGALWAGVGPNALARVGAAVRVGPIRMVLAPELIYEQNKRVPDVDSLRWYRPPLDTTRFSRFASPWNQMPFSMDIPIQPGLRIVRRLDAGQSTAWTRVNRVEAGFSTENQWWGPGVHDALILTNNAGGFPHAFVRTARPLRTRVGDVEARWLAGALNESAYFDFDSTNDVRSIAALAATLRPRFDPNLTLGIARAVYATAPRAGTTYLRWFDVFQATRRPNARAYSDTTVTGGRDQLTSLFARWIFPHAKAEVWGEVGRGEWPSSLRDLLVDPTHTMAYIGGGQGFRTLPWRSIALRLQGEIAFLERSSSYRWRPTMSWYTSRAAPQGYTQRGQPLGASIGPGSSHQWLALDALGGSWQAGLFAARWRYNADWNGIVYFPDGTGWCEWDVTLYPGARVGWYGAFGALEAEGILENRLNYLYENNSGCPRGRSMRDERNATLRVHLTAARFR